MLEQKIEALTLAVVALTAAMSASAGKPAAAPAAPTAPKAETKKADAPVLNKDGETAGYLTIKQPFLGLVKATDRDAALKVIAPLKALSEIKAGEQTPGQYAELLAKIQAAMPPNESGAPSLV